MSHRWKLYKREIQIQVSPWYIYIYIYSITFNAIWCHATWMWARCIESIAVTVVDAPAAVLDAACVGVPAAGVQSASGPTSFTCHLIGFVGESIDSETLQVSSCWGVAVISIDIAFCEWGWMYRRYVVSGCSEFESYWLICVHLHRGTSVRGYNGIKILMIL